MIVQLIVKSLLSVTVKTNKYASNVYLDEGEMLAKVCETSVVNCKFQREVKAKRKKKEEAEKPAEAPAWKKKRGEKEKRALLKAAGGGKKDKRGRELKKARGSEKENKITNYAKKGAGKKVRDGVEIIDLIDDDVEDDDPMEDDVEDDNVDGRVEVDADGWQKIPDDILEVDDDDEDDGEAEFDDFL